MLRELFGFGEPSWVARLERKLDQIIIQGETDKTRDIRIALADQGRDEEIMGAVQIQQESLDGFADQLGALVTAVNEIDLTVLPEADQTRIITGLQNLTAAVNSKSFPTTEPAPVPEPSPEPGPVEPTPEPETPAEPTE